MTVGRGTTDAVSAGAARRCWSLRIGRRAGALALPMLAVWAAIAMAAPGDLDPSFDGDGKKTIDYTGVSDSAQEVLVQPDGKIVLAGYGNPNRDFAITRLNPDGSYDTSFDTDGVVGVNFVQYDDGWGAALQPDGKIVVAGQITTSAGGQDAAVLRLNPDGSLDTSFDGDGKRTVDYAGGGESAQAVVIQPDGKIVLAGGGNTNQDFAVTRLNPDGSYDTSFDTDGVVGVNFGFNEIAYGVALQADGKLVVAGQTTDPAVLGPGSNAAVMRLNPNGSLDTSFDVDGKMTLDYGGKQDTASAVLIQPDGRILVPGSGNPNDDFAVTRLRTDGSLDPSFDGDGVVGADFGQSEYGAGAALQANGKIVLVGTATVGAAGTDAAILRLNPDGSPDTGFDGDGRKTIDFRRRDDLWAVALQQDGAIVVAGETVAPANMLAIDVAVARVEGDAAAAGGAPAGPVGGPGAAPVGSVPGAPGGTAPSAPGAPGPGPGGGSGSSSVPRCEGKAATIVGTSRRDVLRGTRRADVIVALGGNDVIKAGAGNDLVCAGSGDDRPSGESGRDRMLGGSGTDLLSGGPGDDRLAGQSGRDKLLGGTGNDRLTGGDGIDRLLGQSGRDRLIGGAGKDKLDGGPGKDIQQQ